MTVSAVVTVRTQIAGRTVVQTITRTSNQGGVTLFSMPAGKSGTLNTRTDDNTGIVTVATGHGITTSDLVSVFWEGGSRYNMTVTATTGTTISIDVGSGTNLPVADTALVIAKQLSFPFPLVGNDILALSIKALNRCHVELLDGSSASLARYDMTASEGTDWQSGLGLTNPLAGDTVATIRVANGGTIDDSLEMALLVD